MTLGTQTHPFRVDEREVFTNGGADVAAVWKPDGDDRPRCGDERVYLAEADRVTKGR